MSSSIGVSGAYALPSMDGRDHGDVVISTIVVDSFDVHSLFGGYPCGVPLS
jgi:hypothetical protein